MRIISNKKLIFIMIIVAFFIMLFNFKVYAADTAFSLDKKSMDIKLNGQGFLIYSGGTGTVTWTSSDTSVATVENGTVKGIKIGKATITATRGTETASCEVNVVYNMLTIGGNEGKYVSKVNLILGEHDSEKLTAKVSDNNSEEITNASVTWKSSDTSVVTVNSTSGEIKAVKPGTATITATAAGVSDTCEVTVYNGPKFTDFSDAKYETSLNWTTETLNITGITPSEDKTNYYYVITSNNSKPSIVTHLYGSIDTTESNNVEYFLTNIEDNYIYTRNISKYAELNQDLYLWVIEEKRLENDYYNAEGVNLRYSTKFVVEGKKLERAKLPPLNLILQKFNIGYWNSTIDDNEDNYTYINFNFPTETENRKFTLKIGKVTDSSILFKIKDNNHEGITELLSYAKSHDAIYSKSLTTTSKAYFRSDSALFDGRKLLEDDAYYYIYVEFDDEDNKYYPIEGVTLGQAWKSQYNESWDLWAYTSSDFKWDNLTPNDSNSKPTNDPTTAKTPIPQTGETVVISIAAITLIAVSIISFKKFKHLRDVK